MDGNARRIAVTLQIGGAPVHVGATRADVLSAATLTVLAAARAELEALGTDSHQTPSIVVSGGATTPALVRAIADSWHHAILPTLILSDERWTTDPSMSNAHELTRHLKRSPFADCRILSPVVDGELELSALEWSRRIESARPPFVALLSMGDDGHIASLFPHHATESVDDSVVICRSSPKPPPTRLSLSMTHVRRVPLRLLFAVGASKATALRRIDAGELLPAREAQPSSWFIDEAAASELRH